MIDHVCVTPLDFESCWRTCSDLDLSPQTTEGQALLATYSSDDNPDTLVVSSAQRTPEGKH